MSAANTTPARAQGRPPAIYGPCVIAARAAFVEHGPMTMRDLVQKACMTVEAAKNVIRQGKAKGWLVECGREKHANERRWVAVYEFMPEDDELFVPNAIRKTPEGVQVLVDALKGWR